MARKLKLTITSVLATSLDGKIATYSGENEAQRVSSGFISHDDKIWVESLMTKADAIIVGAGSIRAASEVWYLPDKRNPPWYIYTNTGFPETHKIFTQTNVQKILVSQKHLETKNKGSLSNLVYGNSDPVTYVVNHLMAQSYQKILLFGGRSINQMFFSRGLVDELKLTVCPLIVGRLDAPNLLSDSLVSPISLTLTSSKSRGNHVFLNYRINK